MDRHCDSPADYIRLTGMLRAQPFFQFGMSAEADAYLTAHRFCRKFFSCF